MIDETSTSVAEVKTEVKDVAVKPAAKKTATPKPALKKAVAKKPLAKKKIAAKDAKKSFDDYFSAAKLKESREKIIGSVDKFSDVMKNIAYAQLGICGKIYDEVSSIVDARRAKATKQWSVLIKRGEKIQKTLQKKQMDMKKRIKAVDVKADIKDGVGKVKDSYKEVYGKFKTFTKKAA